MPSGGFGPPPVTMTWLVTWYKSLNINVVWHSPVISGNPANHALGRFKGPHADVLEAVNFQAVNLLWRGEPVLTALD